MAVSSSSAASGSAADSQRNTEQMEMDIEDGYEIQFGGVVDQVVGVAEQVDVAPIDNRVLEVAQNENRVVKGARNGGKTCHQCRQKIAVKSASCKKMKTDKKQCPMKICEKCLLNRYGERAEEKEALDNWECPKCRGICNCSQCMRKKGFKPTGLLVYTAKKAGFSSVSIMLNVKGPEVCQELAVQNRIAVSEGAVSSSAGENSLPKLTGAQEVEEKRENMDNDDCVDPTKESQKKKTKSKARKLDAILDEPAVEVELPQGSLLSSVNGIDLLPEEVGHALQFLEFCSTFGEVLEIRTGQPECVLRDITSERGRCKGIYSTAVRFFLLLMSFILNDEEEISPAPSAESDNDKDSWIHSLKQCISNSDCALADIPKDFSEQGFDGFEMLEPCQKLKLLTFLCDETLCTTKMRNWIEDQHQDFVTKEKEARKTVREAKEKEKKVSKKGIAENEDLHTNSEPDTKVSETKPETEQPRPEISEAEGSVPKEKEGSNALRTQPILFCNKSHVFWRLNCVTDSELLCQVIEDPTCQSVSNERWFNYYDAEEQKMIEDLISSLSSRFKRRRVVIH